MNNDFCKNCGAPLQPGMNVCGSCGTPVVSQQMNQMPNQPMMNQGQPYQQPMMQQPMINQQVNSGKYNGNAIASLVCSIVSLLIFWWLAAFALGDGIYALRQIKNTNEKGKGLAIAGIVISSISLVLYFTMAIAAINS